MKPLVSPLTLALVVGLSGSLSVLADSAVPNATGYDRDGNARGLLEGYPDIGTTGSTAVIGNNFRLLDANDDDYISEQEAANDSRLLHRWNSLDRYADSRLDRSEFSALESGQMNDGRDPEIR